MRSVLLRGSSIFPQPVISLIAKLHDKAISPPCSSATPNCHKHLHRLCAEAGVSLRATSCRPILAEARLVPFTTVTKESPTVRHEVGGEGLQVIENMVGLEGFEPPTHGLGKRPLTSECEHVKRNHANFLEFSDSEGNATNSRYTYLASDAIGAEP